MYYRLKEDHAAHVKALKAQMEDQRSQIIRLEKEMMDLQAELSAQKEANVRSPSNTMKNLVEDQKRQLTKKDRHIKVVLFLLSGTIFLYGRDGFSSRLDWCDVLQVASIFSK